MQMCHPAPFLFSIGEKLVLIKFLPNKMFWRSLYEV